MNYDFLYNLGIAMLTKLKEIIKNLCADGIHAPMVLENTGKKSVTLTFVYFAGTIVLFSVIALHFWIKLLTASLVSIAFWVIATVLYMFRSLHKAKIDLDDKSLELEGEDNEQTK